MDIKNIMDTYYNSECNKYDVKHKILPVLPHITDGYNTQNIRIMNIGLNAYLEDHKIDKEGSEIIYPRRWGKWAENVKSNKDGGDTGSQKFHRYVAKQTKIFSELLANTCGEYWLNYVKIYLKESEGKSERKLDDKHLNVSKAIFINELKLLEDNHLLPNIILVYGNSVWDNAIIPALINKNDVFTCIDRQYGYSKFICNKSGSKFIAYRLTHPGSYKKYRTAQNIKEKHRDDIKNYLDIK